MIKLEKLDNTKLSYGIKSLSPILYETIKVKNKLLDGSYHIQNIGTPLKYITFEILSNHNQVDLINKAEGISEELKLIIDNKYYIGMLDGELSWNRLILRYGNKNNTFYISDIRLNISGEGSI